MVDELDALSELFDQITHVAWWYPGSRPAVVKPYESVDCALVRASGGERLVEKVGILRHIPSYLRTIVREVRRSDVVHVRCPSSIGLLGLIVLWLLPRPRVRWAKFAGNWQGRESEPFSYKLQRLLLRRAIHRGPVTVNNRCQEDPSHVFGFHNASVTKNDIEGANRMEPRQLSPPYRLLFVGRVERAKGVHHCVAAVRDLVVAGVPVTLDVLGDGPERAKIESEAALQGVDDHVRFHGWVERQRLSDFYRSSHLLLLPSRSEGWPKVVGEAMAWGAVPVVTEVSSVGSILRQIGGGTTIPSVSTESLIDAIQGYLGAPDRWAAESMMSRQGVTLFTYDRYVREIGSMLDTWFSADHGKPSVR